MRGELRADAALPPGKCFEVVKDEKILPLTELESVFFGLVQSLLQMEK